MLKTEVIMDHKMQYKEGAHMELDIYIPELMLAFEYQGGMHYDTAEFFYGSSKQRQARDNLKQVILSVQLMTYLIITESVCRERNNIDKNSILVEQFPCNTSFNH
jgi:hypothetical protein